MNKDQFFDLAEKYSRNECSFEEAKLFEKFFDQMQQNPKEWDSWELNQREKTRLAILQKIRKQIDLTSKEPRLQPIQRRTIGWAVAASIALLIISGLFYQNFKLQDPAINYITKSTTRGQKATITLSDGSVVKLNSESSITYPESFASLDSRDIKLTGEAFFEVRENSKKPFIVKTSQINTVVLGTSFNINAYPDLPSIYVTLKTGRIKVGTNKSQGVNRNFEIKPGEQIIFEKDSRKMQKAKVDVGKYLAWRDGQIIFDRNSMAEVAKRLERWYNVSFQFESHELTLCVISGEFKSDNLQNILENLQFLTNLEFELDNKKVFVGGQKCI